ncbi:hypothetical protein ACN9M1_17125 [Ralstonia sp. R-29]|uniref:hypothetical protein n=1 Tax=Ralstonia sp. R-29 TaxID=3404059 RepID=UPI003CF9CD3B
MDELRRLSGEEQALVPNLRLRDSLGWDEVRYKSVKSRLNAEGLLVVDLHRILTQDLHRKLTHPKGC